MNDLKREWYDIKTLLPCVISYCWKNQMCNKSALSSFLHPIRFLGITEIERLLCFLKNSLISIVTMLCFTVRECYRMNVSTAPNWNLIPNNSKNSGQYFISTNLQKTDGSQKSNVRLAGNHLGTKQQCTLLLWNLENNFSYFSHFLHL